MSAFINCLKKYDEIYSDNINYNDIVLTDKIYDFWNKAILSEIEVDEKLKKPLALSLERVAKYLTHTYDANHKTLIELSIFPIIVQVVRILKEDIMPEEIVSFTDNFYGRFKNVTQKYKELSSEEFDLEAELIKCIADCYICRLIRSDKYKLVKTE